MFSTSSTSTASLILVPLFLVLVIPPLVPTSQQRQNLIGGGRLSLVQVVAASADANSGSLNRAASSQSSSVATANFTFNNSAHNQTSAQASGPTAAAATSATTTQQKLLNLVKTSFNTANSSRLAPFKSRNSPGQQRELLHIKTTYACEGNQLELSCQEGKLIHLVRANYGRFSLSICNEQGHSNLSVQCFYARAFLIMETRCNKLSNCSVIVSNELFGDECVGTSKYLEVQYYCDDVSGQQQQQSASSASQIAGQQQQQQVITTGPASRINNQAQQLHHQQQQQQAPAPQSALDTIGSLSATPAGQLGGHKSLAAAVQNGGGQRGQQAGGSAFADLPDSESSMTATTNGNEPSSYYQRQAPQPSSSVIQQQQATSQWCAPQTSSRNLYWNYTRAGQAAQQPCPDGSSGRASWLCDASAGASGPRYSPAWSPDFTQCRSNWLQRLAQKLDQMLESPSKQQQQSAEMVRQQNELLLKEVLNDLALMARTKELFSEDLKRIDIMVGQMIAQLRSLSALAAFGAGSGGWQQQQQPRSGSLYEELFSKLVSIVSSLFDSAQRNAWLDVQPNELRRRLEQRFLGHLKEAGVLLANSFGASQSSSSPLSQLTADEQQPWRQANVFAGITVINGGPYAANFGGQQAAADEQFNLQLKQTQSNLNRFVADPDDQIINEFKLHMSVLRELVAMGITRLLVLDIKKPDYALIRQQLEMGNSVETSAMDNNLAAVDQQWSSRVFGVFAIVGEHGDVLDGRPNSNSNNNNNQQELRLAELLAQWPISVDFKVAPLSSASSMANAIGAQLHDEQQPALRQCNSLSDNVNQPNRCHTLRSNATNHVCRCDHFGFVALTSAQTQLVPPHLPAVNSGDLGSQWPQLISALAKQQQQPTDHNNSPYAELAGGPDGARGPVDHQQATPAYIGAHQSGKPTSGTSWSAILVAFSSALVVVSIAAYLVNAALRASAQSRLNKKQGFLGHHQRDLSAGPTTGPLADHSLMSAEPMVAGNNHTGTTHSTSIIGLNQSACQGYKTQQLYAAHLPPLEAYAGGCGGSAARHNTAWWSAAPSWWTRWRRPSHWLWPFSSTAGSKGDHMVQHRVVGAGSLVNGSIAYKSQYQNGYTTGLHHHHHHSAAVAAAQLPLAAPSSSTSSYVSSSAYYEEIGPGNLTKVNTSQLAAANQHQRSHTIVDPFKRQSHATTTAADQQQLLSTGGSGGYHHHHHHHNNQQQQLHHGGGWSPATTGLAYSQQQPASNYGQPMSMTMAAGGGATAHKLHNDLSQLQSSSSSAGSQHSASTNVTTATNGNSTPRHYLFASPSAVSAYKSSMSQQALLQQQQQHCQQQQQQAFKNQEQQHRGGFMQN